jgi:hypothetical protein
MTASKKSLCADAAGHEEVKARSQVQDWEKSALARLAISASGLVESKAACQTWTW